MILRSDPEHRDLCPLQQILALAISDRALEGVERVEDLLTKYRPPKGQPFQRVPLRDCMREVPLLRMCNEVTSVHSSKIWTYHLLLMQLKNLGKRAGYSNPLRPYNFRRGHGSVLDRKYKMGALMPDMSNWGCRFRFGGPETKANRAQERRHLPLVPV